MHDPMVQAHNIHRPWPQRSTFPAAPDGVRWRLRLHHDHFNDGPDPCGCKRDRHGEQVNPFPWWKPRSYSSFWRLAGRDFYWPPVVTIWHVEPGGRDGLSVCSRRYQDKGGTWHYTRSWRWHVHHWHFTVHPYQAARRWLLTRCEVCGGKSRKGNRVNIGGSWYRPKVHWWQGERGLAHHDCYGPRAEAARGERG